LVDGVDRWTASTPGYFVGEDRLEESFSSGRLGTLLHQEVPQSVRDDLRRLWALTGTPAASRGVLVPFVPLLRLLGESLNEATAATAGEVQAPTWTKSYTQASAGEYVTEPAELELLRRFESVEDPSDPLRGLHAPPGGGCDDR